VKKSCIVVNFLIWIIIKNYWCDIKSEKSVNVLMLISSEKYKKKNEKKGTWTVLLCNVARQTNLSFQLGCQSGDYGSYYFYFQFSVFIWVKV